MATLPKYEGPALIIGKGRISFPNINDPKETPRGERYDITLLLPPEYNFQFLVDACQELAERAWGRDRKKWPGRVRGPEQVVRACSEKPHLSGYEDGWHFVHAISSEKPMIVSYDPNVEVADPEKELYAGRWAKISCRPFIYEMREGVGVSLGLNNIQLLTNDARFGRTKANQDFDVEAEEMNVDF